jgi:maleate isomerase
MNDAARPLRWGVVISAPNRIIESDLRVVSPERVTFHASRIGVSGKLDSDKAVAKAADELRDGLPVAVQNAVAAQIDHLIVALSVEPFRGGVAGAQAVRSEIEQQAGVPVSIGPQAMHEALLAVRAQRIAMLTPLQPEVDRQFAAYFEEAGFDVVRVQGLKFSSGQAIASASEEDLIARLREIDGDDVDAIVQMGTNLPMFHLAAEAERWLGKPVLAMNAALIWHALRTSGVQEKYLRMGTLLAAH